MGKIRGSFRTIIPMYEIINKIGNIALPELPLSTIILGSINGGPIITYQKRQNCVLKSEVNLLKF